jgi:chromosome partitioning protein
MNRTFTAGRLAEIAGVTRDRISQLETEGVLAPARGKRNQRLFSVDDVSRLLELTGQRVRKGISVVNQKGGVGKTTTVFNVAGGLVLEGRKVLVVDLDAQASLTVSFGLDPSSYARTSHDLLTDDNTAAADVIASTPVAGLDLIPADIRLASADVLLREMIMRERILATKLEKVADRYDVILFDCPPNLSTITINALVASTDAVVPMETQFYSIRAVDDLTRTFNLLAARMNHHLSVWMLPTKIDLRIKLTMEFLKGMEANFKDRMLTPIRTDSNLAKAPMIKEPAVFCFPASRGSKDYRRIARDLLAPVIAAEGTGGPTAN